MSQAKYPRTHYSQIAANLSKDVTVVGHLKGGNVLELPEHKSLTLKNFNADELIDKYIEVRGTLLDTQSLKAASHSDFGKEFGSFF